MDLQDWGSIGEMVGGVAVIVTLGYLAVQIRQSTRATIAQSELNSHQMAMELSLPLIKEPETAALVFSGLSGEQLTGADKPRFRLYVRLQLQGHQNFFYRH